MSLNSVFITGANRGLGLQFVKHILSLPDPPQYVFAACREPSKASELRNLSEQYPCLKVVAMDVTKDSDIEAVYEQTTACLGEDGLNLLINNAGVFDQSGGSLLEITRDKMQSHFNINATVPALMVQKFLPLLKKAAEKNSSHPLGYRRAAVINLSSIMGSIQSSLSKARCNSYHYRASKTALNMVTALMAVELKESGILVAAIHPGWTQTEMGGASADFETETSVKNVWLAITVMSEKSSGLLHNYDGTVLPW